MSLDTLRVLRDLAADEYSELNGMEGPGIGRVQQALFEFMERADETLNQIGSWESD